ncbi:MAG: hypothetical protein CL528_13370 [Aequorivita sp.]|jgi:hypothetical protein|nr:hypothetical protein [Aequorivita sp.]|tara:strand:+ start:8681 stop:9181 length:501 start_codon:yes stop_codon:yes gene_type:complete
MAESQQTKLPEYSVSNDAQIALYLMKPNHSTSKDILLTEREDNDGDKVIIQQEVATKYKEMLQIENGVGFLSENDMHYASLLTRRMHITKLLGTLTKKDYSNYYNIKNDELHDLLVHSGSLKGVRANLTKTSKVEHSANEVFRDYSAEQQKKKKGLLGMNNFLGFL